ncbi:conserved hypothetical protein [Coccidioides posadasii str. Silveira]|uniref:Uncharacterized protein n=1 Tax=Coccidioides posadasii (strain RMSCC 757 / Silveira) TaxID=443226 RepID=E9D6E9_COCPS|nr:conserved hypothetical protein [Coccidioides posadasii str. Silveira]
MTSALSAAIIELMAASENSLVGFETQMEDVTLSTVNRPVSLIRELVKSYKSELSPNGFLSGRKRCEACVWPALRRSVLLEFRGRSILIEQTTPSAIYSLDYPVQPHRPRPSAKQGEEVVSSAASEWSASRGLVRRLRERCGY